MVMDALQAKCSAASNQEFLGELGAEDEQYPELLFIMKGSVQLSEKRWSEAVKVSSRHCFSKSQM
jgi:hypothetical protein